MTSTFELTSVSQLDEIDTQSETRLQIIFKHSTRCSISRMAHRMVGNDLSEMENNEFDYYHLDLLQHRDVSNAIAERYNVRHESPQLLFIRNGKCIYNASHERISLADALKNQKS